jgi:hypothetical protein
VQHVSAAEGILLSSTSIGSPEDCDNEEGLDFLLDFINWREGTEFPDDSKVFYDYFVGLEDLKYTLYPDFEDHNDLIL